MGQAMDMKNGCFLLPRRNDVFYYVGPENLEKMSPLASKYVLLVEWLLWEVVTL